VSEATRGDSEADRREASTKRNGERSEPWRGSDRAGEVSIERYRRAVPVVGVGSERPAQHRFDRLGDVTDWLGGPELSGPNGGLRVRGRLLDRRRLTEQPVGDRAELVDARRRSQPPVELFRCGERASVVDAQGFPDGPLDPPVRDRRPPAAVAPFQVDIRRVESTDQERRVGDGGDGIDDVTENVEPDLNRELGSDLGEGVFPDAVGHPRGRRGPGFVDRRHVGTLVDCLPA
jgi:hypothetical protein